MQDKAERNRVAVNLWTARIIPIVLAGVVGYATYVLVALLCVNYLLVKHNDPAAAIPILVIYFLLFILMTTSFLRLVHITVWDPPYLPLGQSPDRDRQTIREKGKERLKDNGIAAGEDNPGDSSGGTSTDTMISRDNPDSSGLELFYIKDVFTCEMDGRPRWCSQCSNWKPDRAHHCSSSGRCILKMDHFCPWVGGPIGENNFKFFVQFTGYTTLYCLHLLVVMAIYVHKQVASTDEEVDRQFCAILGLATFFGLFTAGMTGTSIDLAMNNLTQVEKLGSKTRTHVMAVLKPNPDQLLRVNQHQPQLIYPEVTYPLTISQTPSSATMLNSAPQVDNMVRDSKLSLSEKPFIAPGRPLEEPSSNLPLDKDHRGVPPGNDLDSASQPPALQSPTNNNGKSREPLSARDLKASRTFAILRMAQGENPWDLGSRLLNLQTLMGTTILDWFLPFRRSPCCNHEDTESQFAIGPSVDMLKASVSFIEAKDIRLSDGGKKPLRDPYLDIEATKYEPSDGRNRRRRRRKRHRKREHNDSATSPSPDAENPPIWMEDMNGNASMNRAL